MKSYIVIFLFIILSIFFYSVFYVPETKIEFHVTNFKKDTLFKNPIFNVDDGFGRNISISAIGILNDSTEIFLKSREDIDKISILKLPKGKVNAIKKLEYYEPKANIYFSHKNAYKGDLKIIFQFLTPSSDTISR